jgi:deoxyribonuclease-4
VLKIKTRVGVCLDTCHTFSAGYDLTTPDGYERDVDVTSMRWSVFAYFKGLHLNDGKKTMGSRVDRHASLGHGTLGLETFRMIMNDPRFSTASP